jgi:hypothetical protein
MHRKPRWQKVVVLLALFSAAVALFFHLAFDPLFTWLFDRMVGD